MKKGRLAALLLTTLITTKAFAVLPGFYMGLMLGPANNNGGPQQVQLLTTPPTTATATPKAQQFGSSIYMGYKASQNFGGEGGLGYFSGIKYDAGNANTCSTPNVRVRYFDVVGRASYTMGASGFEVFGKAGPALTYTTTAGCLNTNLTQQCGKSTYTNQVKPLAAVGLSYDMSQNWVVDASWTRLFVGGVISSMDMFALGISYHFVDTYCGQFLCA